MSDLYEGSERISYSLENLPQIAKKIISFAGSIKIWCFEGEMGAGKTTLIKALGDELGITDRIQSPTFSLVNEYQDQKGDSIYHFDFFRIKSLTEAFDIGYEEYFYSDKLCWIEWGSKIHTLLPQNLLQINIQVTDINSRSLELKKLV